MEKRTQELGTKNPKQLVIDTKLMQILGSGSFTSIIHTWESVWGTDEWEYYEATYRKQVPEVEIIE